MNFFAEAYCYVKGSKIGWQNNSVAGKLQTELVKLVKICEHFKTLKIVTSIGSWF